MTAETTVDDIARGRDRSGVPTRIGPVVRARPAGALRDVATIAGRSLRAVPRDLEAVLPPVLIAFFFFIVNVGTLKNLTQAHIPGFDYTSFQMATAVLLGVTGVSRAQSLVVDVQNGYFDRLLLTPVRRSAILVGHMVADITVSSVLCVPILGLAFALGIDFKTGVAGVLVFILIAALWSLSFAGFGYAIALKTGNPAAVNSSFLLFFPFLFLTSSYVPRDQLSGWLDTVAGWNPVTYLLEGLRSLALVGWRGEDLAKAALALLVVFLISFGLCFAALRARVRQR
jgi:ABC-2 type transport system permease protein